MKRFCLYVLVVYFSSIATLFATEGIEDPEEINKVVRAVLSNPTAVNWLTYEINNGYEWYEEHAIAGHGDYVEVHLLLRKNNLRKRIYIGFSMRSKLISSIGVTQEKEALVYRRLNTNIFTDYNQKYYCIQVKSYPPAEYLDGLKIYKELRDKGYLVYYYTQYIQNKNWLRVRIGYFQSKKAAGEFGEKFRVREDMDYFVTEADHIFVDPIGKGHTIISTPSSRYVKSAETIKEIYSIYDKIHEEGYLFGFYKPVVTSDQAIILFFDTRVIKYDLKNAKTHILSSGRRFINSSPKLSPSGKYVAYLDQYGWGSPTSLRLIDTKENLDSILVDQSPSEYRQIKKYDWIPNDDKLLFISGSAYTSSGGELYLADVSGNAVQVISTGSNDSLELVDFIIKDNGIILFFAHKILQADKPSVKKYSKQITFESLKNQRTISLNDLK